MNVELEQYEMVAKLVLVAVLVVATEIAGLKQTTLLQLILATNGAIGALVLDHRGRITALESVMKHKHPPNDD